MKYRNRSFLHDLVGHGKLVVDGFLGKYGRPGIEGADILTLQFLRAQVLEKQVQFRERVRDGRSREERRPQVAARALLYGTQREKHVERPLRPLGISEARHPVMPGRESQVLEFVALVHVEVSIPMRRKSTASSLRVSSACATFCNLASRLALRF